jgi:formate hydrogenlyase subunit 6/NADH:ubiquinone oxidoreductase subunit I
MSQISFKEKRHIPRYDDREEVIPGKVAFDYDKCTGCKLCQLICPADCLVMKDKRPEMVDIAINECMGCANCVAICPEDAIKFVDGNRFTGWIKTIDRGDITAPRL